MSEQNKGVPKSPAWAALEEAKLRRHPLVGELAKEVGEEAAANLVRGSIDDPYMHSALWMYRSGLPLAGALAEALRASCEDRARLVAELAEARRNPLPAALESHTADGRESGE